MRLSEYSDEELAWHGFARADTTAHNTATNGTPSAASGTPAAHTPNTGTADETAAPAKRSKKEASL